MNLFRAPWLQSHAARAPRTNAAARRRQHVAALLDAAADVPVLATLQTAPRTETVAVPTRETQRAA